MPDNNRALVYCKHQDTICCPNTKPSAADNLLLLLHVMFWFVKVFRWGCLATETLCYTRLCHCAVAAVHTHSPRLNMLNIAGHWWSQHTRIVSGEANGYGAAFHERAARWLFAGAAWINNNRSHRCRDETSRDSLTEKTQTHGLRHHKLPGVKERNNCKTDPPPAHPVGLPWQRVTWFLWVIGANGPDASGELKGRGRWVCEGEEDEENIFYLLFRGRKGKIKTVNL